MDLFPLVAAFIMFATVPVVYLWERRTRRRYQRITGGDAAFEGSVSIGLLTDGRVAEIRDKVDRVGVVPFNASRGSKYDPVDDQKFEIFLIDIQGAIHDVTIADSPESALTMAQDLADRFDVPLEIVGPDLAGHERSQKLLGPGSQITRK